MSLPPPPTSHVRSISPSRMSLVKQVTLRSALVATKVMQRVPLVHIAAALATHPTVTSVSDLEMPPDEDQMKAVARERAATASRGPGPARQRLAISANSLLAAQTENENDISWLDQVRVARGITSTAAAAAAAAALPKKKVPWSPMVGEGLLTTTDAGAGAGTATGTGACPPPLVLNHSVVVPTTSSGKQWRNLEDLNRPETVNENFPSQNSDFPTKNPALLHYHASAPSTSSSFFTKNTNNNHHHLPAPPTTTIASPPPSRSSSSHNNHRRRESVVRFSEDVTQGVTYDSHVAFETTDGWFLTMHPKTGLVSVREPEEDWQERRCPPFSGSNAPIFVFRIASMTWPLGFKHGQPVSFSDPIWLVAIDGMGTKGWQSGAVLAPKITTVESSSNFNHTETWAALGGSLLGAPPPNISNRKIRPLGTTAPRLHAPVPLHFIEPIEGLHSLRSPWPNAHTKVKSSHPQQQQQKNSTATAAVSSSTTTTATISAVTLAPGSLRTSLQTQIEDEQTLRSNKGASNIFSRLYKSTRLGLGTVGPTKAFVPSHAVHVAGGAFILVMPLPGEKGGGEGRIVRPTDMDFPGAYSRQQEIPLLSGSWEFKRADTNHQHHHESSSAAATSSKPQNHSDSSVSKELAVTGGRGTPQVRNFSYVAISSHGQYIVHQPAQADPIISKAMTMTTEGGEGGSGDGGERDGNNDLSGSRGGGGGGGSRSCSPIDHHQVISEHDDRHHTKEGGTTSGETASKTHSRAFDSSYFIRQEPDGLCGGSRRIPIMITANKDAIERKGYFRIRVVTDLGAKATAKAAVAKANAEDFAIRTGGGGGGGGGGGINILESTTTPAASVVNGDASEVGGGASKNVNEATFTASRGRSAKTIAAAVASRLKTQVTLDEARILRLGAVALRAPPFDKFGNPQPASVPDIGDASAAENLVSSTRALVSRAQTASDTRFLSFEIERTSRGAPLAYAQLVRQCSAWEGGGGPQQNN